MDDPTAAPAVDQDSGWIDVPPTTPAPGAATSSAPTAPDTGWLDVPTPQQKEAQSKQQDQQREQKPEPPSVTDFLVHQAPSSLFNAARNVGNIFVHPIDTGDALGNLVAGTFKAAARGVGIDMPENESDQVARASWQYLKDRYGSLDAAKSAFYHDPVGSMLDVSTVLTGAGGVIRGVGAAADVAGAARAAEAVSAAGRGVQTAAEWTNPVSWATKPVSAGLNSLAPKAAAKLPAFDPKTASFEGETGDFDPKTKTFEASSRYTSPVTPKPAPPPAEPDLQGAITQRAYDLAKQRQGAGVVPGIDEWKQAEQDIRNKPPKAPEAETPPAPKPTAKPTAAPAVPPTVPDNPIFGKIRTSLAGAGLSVGVAELVAHHIYGAVGTGLMAGAIQFLPMFLKMPQGQRLLTDLTRGSNVADRAAQLVPALNAAYKLQLSQQQMAPITVQDWPWRRATGGTVNPELARVQRDRLRLPGILETLEKNK